LLGKKYGRATALGIIAARQAIRYAGLKKVDDASLYVGTTMGEAYNGVAVSKGKARQFPINTTSSGISSHLSILGQNMTIPTACAAGNYAIGFAADQIRAGRSDVAVAGGTDAFSRIAFIGFSRLQVMSPDLCRPFDRYRRGLIVSEGSGFLVLEEESRARGRSAKILAEVRGYGLSCDGFHIAAPHPSGTGAVLAMRRAMQSARVSTSDVDYISAHGTGTIANDRIESRAIHAVFQRKATRIPVSSVKALLGHSMGAASAIEAVLCCLMLKKKVILPTWNYQERDPECDLDYVPNEPRHCKSLKLVLSNSFAFGGNNACLALGTYN